MSDYGSATFKVSLWLNNDQGLYESAREVSEARDLQDWLLELVNPEGSDSFTFLLLADLLGTVDWDEVYDDLHSGDEPEDDGDED